MPLKISSLSDLSKKLKKAVEARSDSKESKRRRAGDEEARAFQKAGLLSKSDVESMKGKSGAERLAQIKGPSRSETQASKTTFSGYRRPRPIWKA